MRLESTTWVSARIPTCYRRARAREQNRAYPNLTQGFFPAVVAEMLRQDFTADEIAKVGGGNYCRVFGQVTSSHA
jgi:hypothetical protein